MWENRSEALKEYTYVLILKKTKMREWSVKSAKKRVENPRVVHYVYGQVFIRQAWCTDRPHSFCGPTHFHPIN
jgi:hypothetical protein